MRLTLFGMMLDSVFNRSPVKSNFVKIRFKQSVIKYLPIKKESSKQIMILKIYKMKIPLLLIYFLFPTSFEVSSTSVFDIFRSVNAVEFNRRIVLIAIRLRSFESEFVRSVMLEIIVEGRSRVKYSKNIEIIRVYQFSLPTRGCSL